MHRFSILTVIALSLLAPVALAQELIPAGEEFQINTYTTGDQSRPDVAMTSDGHFVVVWVNDESYNSTTNRSIQGRRFSPAGAAIGDEFQVNSCTTVGSPRPWPAVDVGPAGEFVVVWKSDCSYGSDSSGRSIQGKRFTSDGTPIGNDFQVNSLTSGHQHSPSVGFDADGNFVVTWVAPREFAPWSLIRGRRFASTGAPIGDDFQISDILLSINDGGPSVAVEASGHFVVVWTTCNICGLGPKSTTLVDVQGRRFALDGTALGDQFQVNSYTPQNQSSGDVDIDADGNFVAVWWDNADHPYNFIKGKKFTSDGQLDLNLGEFKVNSDMLNYGSGPAVTFDADGDFLVVWHSLDSTGSDASSFSIQQQMFSSDGTPFGKSFQVNSYTTDRQVLPALAVDAQNRFIVVWESLGSSGTDSFEGSIQGQRYFKWIFADGLESGMTSAWSDIVP